MEIKSWDGYQKLVTASCLMVMTSISGLLRSQLDMADSTPIGSIFHVVEKYGFENVKSWTRMFFLVMPNNQNKGPPEQMCDLNVGFSRRSP